MLFLLKDFISIVQSDRIFVNVPAMCVAQPPIYPEQLMQFCPANFAGPGLKHRRPVLYQSAPQL